MKNIFFKILIAALFFAPKFSWSQVLMESDMLGDWQCESLLHGSTYKQGGFVKGWQVDAEGLTVTLPSQLTFTRATNGSFHMASSSPNPINLYSSEAINSSYKVKGGQILVFTYFNDGTNYLYEIRKNSDSQITFYPVADGFHPTLICNRSGMGFVTTPETLETVATAASKKNNVTNKGKKDATR